MFGKKRVYLDYAAATPLLKAAFVAMRPYLTEQYANASAIHKEGVVARQAVEMARGRVAAALMVRPEFVTFTSGGTESNNLALIGIVEHLHNNGRSYSSMEVITTAIEHPSILETMKALEARGVVVRYVAVDAEGFVKHDALWALLNESTVLLSVAYANSEIGTVQKLHALKKVLTETEKKFDSTIFFHVDAAQAPLWLSCQFDTTYADVLSLDAGKCCGPKGVGVVIRSRRTTIAPASFGGGQESGLRPGTENVAGIVGASVAIVEAQKCFKVRAAKVAAVRDAGIALILKEIPNAVLNGPAGDERLANNINISIPGLDTEFAAVVLDSKGFAVSTKSACAGAGGGESVVVKDISGDPARARSTLRFSLSPKTTQGDLQRLVQVLQQHQEKMR